MSGEIVFLLDVDNTLLDNDQVIADLNENLVSVFGPTSAARYWKIFDALRDELGYVDYFGALQKYRQEVAQEGGDPQHLLQVSGFLMDYPFAERLYPRARDVIGHLGKFGTTVLLTDGDVIYQPRKVRRSGLWDAVDGRVLIYVHKELMLDDVQRRYPARHYVMVDDKVRILTAMKEVWRDQLTTIFPRQGRYALDPKEVAAYPAADFTIDQVGELADVDLSPMLA